MTDTTKDELTQEPIGDPMPVPPEVILYMRERATEFRLELTTLLNRFSCENGCDTPDFILAEFLIQSLAAFDAGVIAREKWYSRSAGGRSIPPQRWLTTHAECRDRTEGGK